MDKKFTAGVLTVSDRASRGIRTDKTGGIIATMLDRNGFNVIKTRIVPDERTHITDVLLEWVDRKGLDLIVTTGGTGLSPRDVTPQATQEVLDYQVPGMAEAMRSASLKKTPHAMLSRAIAGVRGSCLLINLPGSPAGARDNLAVVMPALNHALLKLAGDPSDCAA
jgi:molybdenum cofactor synthesis domain-containing protein